MSSTYLTRSLPRGLRVLAIAALLFSVGFVTAFAGTPAGYAEYIIPFDEDVFAYVTDPVTAGAIGANDTSFSLISVTAWSDTVTVYYDHWENGYNYDPNNPDATADEKYVVNMSQTLNFQSLNIPRPRTLADGNTYRGNVASGASPTADCTAQPAPAAALIRTTLNYCYDGRDRIVSVGGATTVTRGGYMNTAGLGKLAAIGEEVYPLAPQLVKYILPFGDDPARPDYERVAALIQATEDNTAIQIDFDGNGVYDAFNTENGYRTARVDPVDSTVLILQKGQTYVLDTDSNGIAGAGLPRGAVILGDKTLQVEFFYGELNSNYNTRAVSAFPRGFWGTEYYASADGGAVGTDILLYNPNASGITINWETTAGSGSFAMAANETAFFQAKTGAFLPEGSGAYLKGTGAFWGTSDIDQNSTNYDWGYGLVPAYLLSDDQVVAWAPGNSPALACNAADGRANGLFITPANDNTTFFIDANGDGAPDTNASIEVLRGTTVVTATGSGYRANRLESLYITGSNSGTLAGSLCDLTGARIYATGPFSMAYGENPAKASAGGGLDLGYTVLPSPSNWMDLALTVDKATNPVLVSTVAGATEVTYTLVVKSHNFNIDAVSVADTLPANWEYKPGSAVITFPNLTTSTANPTGTPGPVLTWNSGVLGSLLPHQQITITFVARTTAAFAAGAVTQNTVEAVGTRNVGGVTQTFNTSDFVLNAFTDGSVGMAVTKTSSVPANIPVSPGDALTYTISVTNPPPAVTTLTGVTVYDALPPGITYVPGSGSVTCEPAPFVRDSFNTNGVFTGNNGNVNWATNWVETNDDAAANAGDIQIAGNRIEWQDTTDGGEYIMRSATVTGSRNLEVQYSWDNGTVEAGEGVAVEWSLTGAGGWTTLRTLDGNSPDGIYSESITWTPANTTIFLRFNAVGDYDGGDEAYIDNVQITGVAPSILNVRDEFAAVAYTNQGPNNTNNWATNWTETDVHGTVAGATAGFALVTGNTLQLRGQTSQTLDNFSSVAYNRQDGTALWTSDWTEAGDDNTAGGGVVTSTGARLNFGPGTTGRSISRTAAVSGGTVTLGFTLSDNGADANEGVFVEYRLGAGPFLEVGRITDGTIVTGAPNALTFSTAGATQITIRVTSFDTAGGTFEGGDNTGVDAVSVTYNNAIGTSVQRTANLTGAISPALSFTTAVANLEVTDTVVVEAATSAAGPFTTLATYAGGTPSIGGPYDLTPYISATTTIRYRITGNYDVNNEIFSIDNVNIAWTVPLAPAVLPAGPPPGFVGSSQGCVIRPGGSLTLTFNATVDSPFPIGQSTIQNSVATSVNELPVPLTATATNIVLVPSAQGATVGDRVWMDANTNGVFDVGETGISGVQVTLKDQFGTPLQVTTTDAQGRYVFLDVPAGSGYFVQVTGGLPAGLTQTTDTFRDNFDTNGSFTGNNGTLNWLTNWTETGDNANPASGDIQVVSNRIEFRDAAATVAANESVQRSARVAGATSLQVQYSWAGTGLAAGTDRILVQSSTDGVVWTTIRTIDNAAAQTFTDTVAWTPTNATFFLRYTNQDILETGKLATIDNVQVRAVLSQRTAGFDLAAAQNYIQADLGFRAANGTAAIGDTVWVDANNDQTRNPGEVGLAGITVQLFQDTNGDGAPDGAAIATTVTGAGGAYLFTGIAANGANDYVVTMNTLQPALAGYTATTYTLFSYPDLPSGAVRIDADFGFQNPGGTYSITDGIWLDNGTGVGGVASDGVRNGTEPGIAGVTVNLLNGSGSTIATTTTAANGTFQFTGVPGGQNYTWRITDDAGVLNNYFGTTGSALSGSFQMTGNLASSLNYTSPSDVRHFGYNQTRSIGDTVFNDNGAGGGTIGNSVQDGSEPGIAGITVLLYRNLDGDANFEPGGDDGAVYATAVTDSFGHYQFAGLPTGSEWWVSIDNTQSPLSPLTLTTADNSGVAGHQRRVNPALLGGANRVDLDYGYRAVTPFNVSGRFFSDINRNGADDTEAGLGNVTLDLVNNSGVVIASTTTAADGAYGFTGLAAGTYSVRVTDTYAVLAGAETTFEKTEGGLASSYDGREVVVLGPTVTNVTFGFYRTNVQVTQVVISSFTAIDVQGSVALEWTTASEIGTVGFYLKRWDDRKNRYVSVNERLIPSLIGSTAGGTYRFVDREATPGEPYRYVVVEVEASGKRLRYGPYDVDTRSTEASADSADADDDEEAQTREARRAAADTLLLERGEWKSPRRANLKKRLERWTAARAERRQAAGRRRATPAAKIGVSENAFYFVTLEELQASAAMPANPQWNRTYSLTNRGEAVAIAPSSGGDGFWFYGRATESNVERDNVYRLSDGLFGARMGSRKNPRVPDPSGSEVFLKTLHVERDVMAVNNVYKNPDGDFYIWDYVFAGFGSNTFSFRADGAARNDRASVTVRLKGGSDTPALSDHHALFRLNGTLIGEAVWDGLDELVTTLEFDGELLVDGENALVIEGLVDAGVDYSLFYVDSFDVRYSSLYRASNNRAEVRAAGNPAVLISGFTRPDITLFDITSPSHPVFVQAPVIQTPDGSYGVVAASRDPQAAYYALTPDGLVSASRILPDAPSSLSSASNQAEYVVITTEALKDTAQTLADYRSDLSSMVVDIEDIYDEFAAGNASPYAIKSFLTHARKNWRTPPRYVVLAGEGTYDYKDVEGFGDNLIPTMMANTPDGLFPTDSWFVERSGAAAAEIAIGRLPVSTAAELAEVIRKIQVREAALTAGDAWLRDTLLVADNADDGGDFVQSSEAVAGVLAAETPLTRAYISSGGKAAARTKLLNALKGGVGLVNYFGHSGFDYLADELLLKTADVPVLHNQERPSMLFALTCVVGNSALPGYSTLGEELVRQEGGGLAALFAPTGMSANDLATPLATGLHTALQVPETQRIGDAVNAARQSYKGAKLPIFMLQIYNLLGDPAMRVR